MKINYISRLAILLLIVTGACTVQENPSSDPTSSQAISIVAEAGEPGTKTVLSNLATQWVASIDKIGLFSPQAKATQEGTPAANPAINLGFTAQVSAKSSKFSGSMYWGNASAEHTFYAYYPYDSEYTGDQTAVPVSLPPAQIQTGAGNTDHIGALDFLVATPRTVAPGSAVNLTFNHVFSMIEFQITGSGTLSQVRLLGTNAMACEGTIDLTQTPGDDGYAISTSSTFNYVSVNLETSVDLDPTTPVSIYMMVLPGAQNTAMTISLKVNGIWKEILREQPKGGFVRGMKYNVALNTENAGWSDDEYTDSRDRNIYNYQFFGNQVWMTKNLAYLPEVSGPGTGSETIFHYYVYGYNGINVTDAKAQPNYSTYGVLYNLPAALSACPDDWHLPDDDEWATLITYLGGEAVAGGTMKEADGFSALLGGCCYMTGEFGFSNQGLWWSSTVDNDNPVNAWCRSISSSSNNVDSYRSFGKNGFSVRCLRNLH